MSIVDKSFVFPVRRLANDRVSLEPFKISSHALAFVEGTKEHPDLFNFVTYGPFQSVEDFEDTFYRPRIAEKEGTVLWSIFTKCPADESKQDGEWVFAGVLSLDNSSRVDGVTEIGHVCMVFGFILFILLRS